MLFSSVGFGFFNYLSQVVLGHFLEPGEFGALSVLFAIIFIATVLTRSIEATVTSFTVQYLEQGKSEELGRLRFLTYRQVGLLSVAVAIALVATVPLWGPSLDLGPWWYVGLAAFAVIPVLVGSINAAVLRGMQRPWAYTSVKMPVAAGRLALTLVLAWAGWGIPGALVAAIVAYTAGMAASHLLVQRIAPLSRGGLRPEGLYRYSGLVLAVGVAFTLATNLDVILARSFLSSEESGIYAGIAVLGKVLLFLAGGIALSAFSLGSQRFQRGLDPRGIFRRSYLIAIVAFLPVLLPMGLMPETVIRVTLGESYVAGAPYLGLYGLSMALFGLSWLGLNLALATRRSRTTLLFGVALSIEIASVAAFHADVRSVVYAMLAAGTAAFVLSSWPLLIGRASPMADAPGR